MGTQCDKQFMELNPICQGGGVLRPHPLSAFARSLKRTGIRSPKFLTFSLYILATLLRVNNLNFENIAPKVWFKKAEQIYFSHLPKGVFSDFSFFMKSNF